MRKKYRLAAGIFVVVFMVSAFLFPGCTQPEDNDTIETCSIQLENGYVLCDFRRNVIVYSRFDPELEGKAGIPLELHDEYKAFMEDFCRNMLDNRGDYYSGSCIDESRSYWQLVVRYNGGKSEQVAVIEGAERIYPDNWDEFIRRTSEIVGFDVSSFVQSPAGIYA